MGYNLEIEKLLSIIKKEKARRVLLQLPEGLKPEALKLADKIENETDANVFIWLGPCYGACDLPLSIEKDIDLLIHFGHSPWHYKHIKVLK